MADTGKNNKIKFNRLTALEIYIFLLIFMKNISWK